VHVDNLLANPNANANTKNADAKNADANADTNTKRRALPRSSTSSLAAAAFSGIRGRVSFCCHSWQ
jgi:hypothetical protein